MMLHPAQVAPCFKESAPTCDTTTEPQPGDVHGLSSTGAGTGTGGWWMATRWPYHWLNNLLVSVLLLTGDRLPWTHPLVAFTSKCCFCSDIFSTNSIVTEISASTRKWINCTVLCGWYIVMNYINWSLIYIWNKHMIFSILLTTHYMGLSIPLCSPQADWAFPHDQCRPWGPPTMANWTEVLGALYELSVVCATDHGLLVSDS